MLFIANCGQDKQAGDMAALVKYDSRQHRLIAEAFWPERYGIGDDLLFLFAEFGLVPSYQVLPDYERKMDRTRSQELAASSEQRAILARALEGQDMIVVFGGRLYRETVAAMLPSGVEAFELVGEDRGCGDHFSALKAFLCATAEDDYPDHVLRRLR